MDVKYYLEPINILAITGEDDHAEYHCKGGECFSIPKILIEKGLAIINASHKMSVKAELDQPKIVCLCGSTKFKQEFITANFQETMAGRIVLTVGWFSHSDEKIYYPTPEKKKALDELHLRKIDLADEILVLNVGGYIGKSTYNELEYAKKHEKKIRYLEND